MAGYAGDEPRGDTASGFAELRALLVRLVDWLAVAVTPEGLADVRRNIAGACPVLVGVRRRSR